MSSPPPSDPINLSEIRARRTGRRPIPADQADLMVMSHMTGCAIQLQMISLYFLEAGLLDFSEKISGWAREIKETARAPLPKS